jgi:hypothetical protein
MNVERRQRLYKTYKYIGLCDLLRRTPEGENNWQIMMENKKLVPEKDFITQCDFSPLLDEGETILDFLHYHSDDPDSNFYESIWDKIPCIFFQSAGFEYVFKQEEVM